MSVDSTVDNCVRRVVRAGFRSFNKSPRERSRLSWTVSKSVLKHCDRECVDLGRSKAVHTAVREDKPKQKCPTYLALNFGGLSKFNAADLEKFLGEVCYLCTMLTQCRRLYIPLNQTRLSRLGLVYWPWHPRHGHSAQQSVIDPLLYCSGYSLAYLGLAFACGPERVCEGFSIL